MLVCCALAEKYQLEPAPSLPDFGPIHMCMWTVLSWQSFFLVGLLFS